MKNASLQYTKAYILALALLATLTISTQVFIQFLLYNQRHDAHIINISGRQRMLSQKITKQALIILQTQDESFLKVTQENLKKNLDLWSNSQLLLQNKEEKTNNSSLSEQNQKLFTEITPYYQIILKSGQELLSITVNSPKASKEKIVQNILNNEADFLELMNQITFQFEKESIQQSRYLAFIEQLLMIITLLILFLEGWLIFRPITHKVNSSIKKLEEANQVIEDDRASLKKSNANLEVIQKALLKKSSEIEKQKSLLEVSESVSQTVSFDLQLPTMDLTFSENTWKMFDIPRNTKISFELAISFIKPESIDKLKKSFLDAVSNKNDFLTEICEAKHKQQSDWSYFQLYCRIFYNSDAQPIRVLGSVRNIHEQFSKQKELEAIRVELEQQQQELQNANHLLRKASEAALFGSWEIDLEENQMNWSQFAQEIYGINNDFISVQDVIGGSKKWLSFYQLKESQERVQKALYNCLSNGAHFDLEMQILTQKGQEKWVRIIGLPFYYESKIVRLYGLIQDIDAQKQNEEELKSLAVIAEQTSDLIVVTDKNGCIEWVNNGFTQLTEYTFEEAKGEKPGKLLQGVDTNPQHIRKIAEGIASKQSFSQEILNYTKSGEPYWNLINITPILDERENPLKFIGIQHNITRLKNAEQQVKIKNQQLEIMLETVEKQKNDILSSIQYAKLIQKAILSDEEKGLQKFKDSLIFYQPRNIVSGDFYWFSDLGERQVVIMADCTGHGVPGAFMTMLGTTALNEIINEGNVETPAEVLHLLDEKILKTLHSGKNTVEDGMDLGILFFDKTKKKILYSGAKTPLYYRQPNEPLTQIKGNSFPVGTSYFEEKKAFENHCIEWKENTWFYLASDGFQDQFGGENNRKFMKNKFQDLLSEISSLDSNAQHHQLQTTFHNWKKDNTQTDDILVLGIQI